jgi:hypothetical protein
MERIFYFQPFADGERLKGKFTVLNAALDDAMHVAKNKVEVYLMREDVRNKASWQVGADPILTLKIPKEGVQKTINGWLAIFPLYD